MLKDSILKFLKLDTLIEHLTGFVETRIELMKLEIKEEVAKAMARVLILGLLMAVFTLFIMLISMAVAFKIGESLGASVGFAIVAGFYLLVGVLLVLMREGIRETLEKQLGEIMKKKKK
ncbi:Putative Holin-X, holin superfamily III [Chryseolinea serpens]|uniref:Putative Holin-X, holin superfamily III n=1 Tax=Chryseolinea serpens TaxID=947013 RepID=A0A1M5XM85_9BACT|nr:phage holin family protein [Chryseolinea serpens]SHI00859.1 Putative Holin-X, holin superfamily III [Chryseolinea serpens]